MSDIEAKGLDDTCQSSQNSTQGQTRTEMTDKAENMRLNCINCDVVLQRPDVRWLVGGTFCEKCFSNIPIECRSKRILDSRENFISIINPLSKKYVDSIRRSKNKE